MPKGQKLRNPEPPSQAHCDFCGRTFHPVKWDQRTCVACAVKGAPDQSAMPWSEYFRRLMAYMRERGRRAPLTGAALGSISRGQSKPLARSNP